MHYPGSLKREPSQPDLNLPAAAILAPVLWSLVEEIQCGEVCLIMLYLRTVSGQLPALGGIAGTPTYSPTPLVPPVCGLSQRLTQLGGIHHGDGRGGPILNGSPTAMPTAEAMLQHIFQNFGLPEDIVSDRGSQFTSRVWRSLCEWLGINVSLSSRYHPMARQSV
ncbi:hypothetical protein QTP86_027100 [Hemibagrus guttatus]|nr:hypothetical protein QTP86_027100 [Hemibagrus guttatus]